MVNRKINFNLIFPENLKRDSNLSTTDALTFDDLGDFLEEREKIKRTLESTLNTELKVDYSNFANHVFFDSAISKFNIAKSKILNEYPYNGTGEEKDAFHLTGSGYEDYIFNQWPRFVGYVSLNGTDQYISSSDTDNKLLLGSSSLYVSTWIKPVISHQNMILQVLSASSGSTFFNKQGYELYLSGASDLHVKFSLYSGSQKFSVSASYSASLTSSFNNVAAIYDNAGDLLSLYINDSKRSSGTVSFGSVEFTPTRIYIGSGSQYSAPSSSFNFYSGSIDEIRILHTASALFHTKNYSRPIDSESYVVLNYRFNEGITGTGSVDQVVVDYSKNSIHGKILNYTSDARVSGTVMLQDPGDPILYSFHSGVIAFTGSIINSASFYDLENNNLIFNLMPEAILREDENQENLLQAFSLALARFFDETKLYIDQFDNLRTTNYDDLNETPSNFLPMLTRYFGWKVTEHFADANPLPFLFGENILSSGSTDIPLLEIRNQFWRRTLNNLPYLLQTKGKRNNLDTFFNLLGISKENINFKEYGYLPGGSIEDTRIHKEKSVPILGIGTGSLSGSYVKIPSLVSSSNNAYTVECFVQLPFASASYSASLSVLTGSLWQFVDATQVTGSFALLWSKPSLTNASGKFILTGSDGQHFSSSNVEVFDGDFAYIAAGLKSDQTPFIEIRTLDNDVLDLQQSFSSSTALSGVFTGSNYDFIIGATSGTFFGKKTQGFFSEYRYWNRPLSSSEIDSHAYHFESIGINNPAEVPYPLKGHWPLNENKSTNSSGQITNIQDLSRNGRIGTGSDFITSANPYKKFLIEYNYLSPSIDLRWTENKIRIRNKTELKKSEVATDTNEVSLEFNLVDALNRDISKIFSTIDLINNAIGTPVNKYRDEYADLEAYRKLYFDRLGDSIHFTNFFKLFKWFDKKISDSIKQLLPARVKFVGGEQVVESHFLERPKYQYKYPIFRTPVEIPETAINANAVTSGNLMLTLPTQAPATIFGTTARTFIDKNTKSGDQRITSERNFSIFVEGLDYIASPKTTFSNNEKVDKNFDNFFRLKIGGDSGDDVNDPNSGINFRNESSRRELLNKDRDNE